MEGKYLIQTLKPNAVPDIMDKVINSAGDSKDWENYPHSFDDVDRAIRECELLIKNGRYKSDEVRIVEVICTFSSDVQVRANHQKDE